jgi:hypothetical protein
MGLSSKLSWQSESTWTPERVWNWNLHFIKLYVFYAYRVAMPYTESRNDKHNRT